MPVSPPTPACWWPLYPRGGGSLKTPRSQPELSGLPHHPVTPFSAWGAHGQLQWGSPSHPTTRGYFLGSNSFWEGSDGLGFVFQNWKERNKPSWETKQTKTKQ